MEENIISKSKFKPRALQYFRQVEITGKELIISDRGRPVLKIVPYTEDTINLLKTLRNSIIHYEDPMEPC